MTTSMETLMNYLANGLPLSKAMKNVYKTRRISIPYNDGFWDMPITELDLSSRTKNALMRGKVNTLEKFIDKFMEDRMRKTVGFGTTSATEMFEALVDYAWDKMSVKHRGELLLTIDNMNEPLEAI